MNTANKCTFAGMTFLVGIFMFAGREKHQPDLITVNPVVQEKVPVGALTGRQIVLRCAKAYADLETYVGTTFIVSRMGRGRPPVLGDPDKTHAKVWFTKPGKIRIEGITAGLPRSDFVVVRDGKQTWTSWSIDKNGAFKVERDLENAIGVWKGVARGATIVIPSALLQIDWNHERSLFWLRGQFLPALATKVEMTGEERIADAQAKKQHACYKVVCEREIATWTLWIDKESFLLRKMEQNESVAQMDARAKYDIGRGRTGTITSIIHTETYDIESVNQPLDEKLFTPTRR